MEFFQTFFRKMKLEAPLEPITKKFIFSVIQTLKCTGCGAISSRIDSQDLLSMSIPSAKQENCEEAEAENFTLQTILNLNFAEEYVEYFCGGICHSQQLAIK